MRRRGGQQPAVNTNRRPSAASTYDVQRDLVSALHARCFSRMRLNMKQASIPDVPKTGRFQCGAVLPLLRWTYLTSGVSLSPRPRPRPARTSVHLRGTGTARRIGAILCLDVGEAGKGGQSVAHNPPVRNGLSIGVIECEWAGALPDAYSHCLAASRRGWQAGHVKGMKIGRRFPPSGQDVRVLDLPMESAGVDALGSRDGQGRDEGRSKEPRKPGRSPSWPSWPAPTSHLPLWPGQAIARSDSDPTHWLPLVARLARRCLGTGRLNSHRRLIGEANG
jgi:hypothetical protein